jgi:hypothetical protein
MEKTITFKSKFNIGDIVTYDDKVLSPITAKIIDIKLSSRYEFLYRLEGSGIYVSETFLTKND